MRVLKRGFYRAGAARPQADLDQARVTTTRGSLQPEQQQTQADAAQAKKPDLTVLQLQDLREHAPPRAWRQEGQQPFHHEDQGQTQPERVGVHSQSAYFLAGAAAPPAPPRITLKKSDDEGSRTITSLFLAKVAL